MSKHIADIPLKTFEDPIRSVLYWYLGSYDYDDAHHLELTPDKPNTARSMTSIRRPDGRSIGELVVIAFAPEDGTGDETAYQLSDLNTGEYPRSPKVVPRSKKAVPTELHLTIASLDCNTWGADPKLFAGNQDLLGLEGNTVTKLGELGQDRYAFENSLHNDALTLPTVTYTTGYNKGGERFGDPHAVYNPHPVVQVCGFIALSPETSSELLGHLTENQANNWHAQSGEPQA
jgi:hypothetical protein